MPLWARCLGAFQSQCSQGQAQERTLIADEVYKLDQCLDNLTSTACAINQLSPVIRGLKRQLGAVLEHSLELELHIVAEGDHVLILVRFGGLLRTFGRQVHLEL